MRALSRVMYLQPAVYSQAFVNRAVMVCGFGTWPKLCRIPGVWNRSMNTVVVRVFVFMSMFSFVLQSFLLANKLFCTSYAVELTANLTLC